MILGSCCIPLNLVPLGGFRDLLLWGINDYLEEKKNVQCFEKLFGFLWVYLFSPIAGSQPLPSPLLPATGNFSFMLRCFKDLEN
jgi:hypothetical protein